jgi:hypothetical protein
MTPLFFFQGNTAEDDKNQDSAPPRVVLNLKEGSRLVGQLHEETLAFQSEIIGKITLPLARLRSLQWRPDQSHALLTTLSGDKLQARPAGPDLRLKTAYGELRVPWSLVSQMQVLVPGKEVGVAGGLVHRWSAEEDARDAVGDQHGRLGGGAGFAPGKVGLAFAFNGTDAAVELGPEAGNFGTNDFTIVFWYKSQNHNRQESVLNKRPVCDAASFWEINTDANGIGLGLCHDELGTSLVALASTKKVNDGTWRHVALVRQGTAVSLYLEGAVNATLNTPLVVNLWNKAPLRLGVSPCLGRNQTKAFTGQLDELSLFDRALDAAEVEQLFNAANPPAAPP